MEAMGPEMAIALCVIRVICRLRRGVGCEFDVCSRECGAGVVHWLVLGYCKLLPKGKGNLVNNRVKDKYCCGFVQ